jgi:hypothetical protein
MWYNKKEGKQNIHKREIQIIKCESDKTNATADSRKGKVRLRGIKWLLKYNHINLFIISKINYGIKSKILRKNNVNQNRFKLIILEPSKLLKRKISWS